MFGPARCCGTRSRNEKWSDPNSSRVNEFTQLLVGLARGTGDFPVLKNSHIAAIIGSYVCGPDHWINFFEPTTVNE